jgi:DNA adenine methylase
VPEPFLKWPGGKRWLAARVATIIGSSPGRYYEPFLGGGAVFFELSARPTTLSDINSDLINTYVHVRDNCDAVIAALKVLPVTKRKFYSIRAADPTNCLERAVRFLYLNRTCFGGMYRVNQQGRFNVPYGGGERTPECLWATNLLPAASAALQGVELLCSDFEAVVNRAGENDVVYCDPTYTVAHENNGFVRYNERNFGWADQVRLARAAERAARRGALVLLSNAHHKSVRDLYPTARAERISRLSLISPSVVARRSVSEYLFVLGL